MSLPISAAAQPAAPLSYDEPPRIQMASLHLYQLYDVCYSIDLDKAREMLATPSARVRPVVTRGASIDIAQLPLELSLGTLEVTLGGVAHTGVLYARIYDLGIIAFRLVILFREEMGWEDAIALLSETQPYPMVVSEAFEHGLELLSKTLAPAMNRLNAVVRPEDYTIFVVERMVEGVPASRAGAQSLGAAGGAGRAARAGAFDVVAGHHPQLL